MLVLVGFVFFRGEKMDKKTFEKRSYSFEVRAEETEQGNIITGRPIVYNSRTDIGFFDEIIESGALDRTDLTDVRFLVNHDVSKIPLARSRRNNGNSTMLLTVDSQGMSIRVVLDTENNTEAKALYSAVQRGDISGMSFMFSVKDEEWDDIDSDHPTRRIKDISKVVEVSAVTFPSYEATEIFARSKEALDNARSVLEKAGQQNAKPLESGKLELLKAKINLM
jgi:HK97 family phage prohead protease